MCTKFRSENDRTILTKITNHESGYPPNTSGQNNQVVAILNPELLNLWQTKPPKWYMGMFVWREG